MDQDSRAALERAGTRSLKIFRYSPTAPAGPSAVTYRIPSPRGTTVLDGLLWIKARVDATLAFRYSCRMGICGSCGMLVNGVPALACETQLSSLNTPVVELAPLSNHPVLRDVVTDSTDFFARHRKVRPYVVRAETRGTAGTGDLRQTEAERLETYQFSLCIMCGLCNAACPIAAIDEAYVGPQALAQAYRYSLDSRDQDGPIRLRIVDEPHGVYRCELSGSCSVVCPKGVDPALGIQLLKRKVIRDRIRGARSKRSSPS